MGQYGNGTTTTQIKVRLCDQRFVFYEGRLVRAVERLGVPHLMCPHKGVVVGCRVPIALKLSFVYFSTTMPLKPSPTAYVAVPFLFKLPTNYKAPTNMPSPCYFLKNY